MLSMPFESSLDRIRNRIKKGLRLLNEYLIEGPRGEKKKIQEIEYLILLKLPYWEEREKGKTIPELLSDLILEIEIELPRKAISQAIRKLKNKKLIRSASRKFVYFKVPWLRWAKIRLIPWQQKVQAIEQSLLEILN
jgi:hypothetical protein